VDASNLHELRSHVVLCKEAGALSQTEHVLLRLEHLCDAFVLLDVFICQGHVDSFGEHFDVTDQTFASVLHLLVQDCRLFVREPYTYECHSQNLRDKALNVRVAESTLHIEANVLIVLVKDCVGHRH